jgi:hypothetical protein
MVRIILLLASRILTLAVLFGLAGATGPALAGDQNVGDRPAVSGLNGQTYVLGGWLGDSVNDTGMVAFGGKVAAPLGNRFGVQGDTLLAFSHGEFGGGVAGHAFWRDPSAGLLGLYGQWVARHQPNWKTWRGGAEAHAYFSNFDFTAIVGYESPVLPESYGNHDDVFTIADVAYYVSDDARISAGYRYLNGVNIAAVDLELQHWTSNWPEDVSLTLSGRVGELDYAAVWLGLTWNFGADGRSLRARHREDGTIDTEKENIFQIDLPRGYGH